MKTEELKHKIVIQRYTNTINENGFELEAWEEYKTVWSAVPNLHGKEYFQAAAVQAEKTVKFIIRYTENIDATMRLLFNGKQYNITSIDNIKYSNKYIEIKALEVDQNG